MALIAVQSGPSATEADDGVGPQASPFKPTRYDWKSDGACEDIIDSFDGQPQLHDGSCAGAAWTDASQTLFDLEDIYDSVLLPGDWNTDNCEDMIGIKTGELWLLEGDCDHGVKKTVKLPGDFSAFNYFVGPGIWSDDLFPDLLARRSADGALVLFTGDGNEGFSTTDTVVGTGWNSIDIILAIGPGDSGPCSDLVARRIGTEGLRLYFGDCNGGFAGSDQGLEGAAKLSDYDWLFGGGDWIYSDGARCLDIAGWKKSAPQTLDIFAGTCANGVVPDPVAFINPSGWGFPLVGDSARVFFWGDIDCSGAVSPVDALKLLKVDAGQPVNQLGLCHNFGDVFFLSSGLANLWGDIDCKDIVSPVDALKLLKVDAGQAVNQTEEDCPPFGSSFNMSLR